jgi:serine/threonine protein kinase
MPADLIGARYQLHRELARTPSLAVYAAEDRRAGTPAGIAMELGGGHEPRRERRLFGRRLARTVHPHLVSTFDRGHDGKRTYVAFRPPPRTLATELDAAPYPSSRVAPMAVDLSAALAVLHRAGVRLGTLHPGHVGIDADGAVRLSPWPLSAPPSGWGGQRAWSPPEIVAGASPSIAGDVWSLGAVLLSSLVGTGPGQLSEAATQELADRLRQAANPVLVEAIGRSMVADPSSRFASASRMASALQGKTVTRRKFTAAGVPRLSTGTRRLAVASAAAVVGVLSATTVGVGLSSLGGSSVATGGGVDHRPAATPLPPAGSDHRAASTGSDPGPASAPKGVVALSAIPPSTTAITAPPRQLRPTTPTTTPVSPTADLPPTATGTPSAPTNSVPTTTTPTTTTPTTTTPTTTTPTTTTPTTTPSASGNPRPGVPTTPYDGGAPITATHDHGGQGGPGD